MLQILRDNPILLLFVVASFGYLIGNLRIRGNSLGVSAVLFTGLFIGAMDESLQIPEIILLLGLSIYVYSIGLNCGPAFFKAFQSSRIKEFSLIMGMLLFSGVMAVVLWSVFDFSAAAIAGIYSGSTTNTAALAGVIDIIANRRASLGSEAFIEQAVVGYSYSYPMGVIGSFIAIIVLEKLLNIDYSKEKEQLRKQYPVGEELTSSTIEITEPGVCDIQLRDLFQAYDWNVVFGRIYKNGKLVLSSWDTHFEIGDLIMVVGSRRDIEDVAQTIGKEVESHIAYDRKLFDVRSIFVSNPDVAGRTLAALNLDQKYNTIVTRIRRGDMDMLANGETILELGDRIRFIARREDLKALSEYFGDSYYHSSKINLFTFGMGIGLGLLLGTIDYSIGPDIQFKLGYAGGPLVVGLMLGALRRTGPVSWTMPYSANITLQQMGLIFLLAAIGVRSGNAFVQSLSLDGLTFFLAGSIISLLTAFILLLIGYKLLRIPFSLLMGMVANQPAILDFAVTRAKSRIPEFGFTIMFPISIIVKILIAQILYLLLI